MEITRDKYNRLLVDLRLREALTDRALAVKYEISMMELRRIIWFGAQPKEDVSYFDMPLSGTPASTSTPSSGPFGYIPGRRPL